MLTAAQIRKDYKNHTNTDIPISGGDGCSLDTPIIIEERDPAKSAYWVKEVVGFINFMQGQEWEFVESNILEDAEGRSIEQYKISRKSDNENYYNYYFNISAMYSS